MRNAGGLDAATVWAAEHGASSRSLDVDGESEDDSPANVGHRFRIHGRLEGNESQLPPVSPGPGMKLEPELLRQLVAHETEVDVRDVQFYIERDQIILRGTVGDEGERHEIEHLLRRIPGVRVVQNELRVQTV